MVNCTDPRSLHLVSDILRKSKNETKNLAINTKNLSKGKIEFFLEDIPMKSLWIDGLRLIVQSELEKDSKILKDCIIEGFCSVENAYSGSGYFYLLAVLQGLLYEVDSEESIKRLVKHSRRPSVEELTNTINIEEPFIDKFLDFCINEAGFSSSFSVKETDTFNSRFLVSSSYNFPIIALPEFLCNLDLKSISCFDSKIIVYDGMIETVGEIHHLLTYFSENKLDVFLVARGFSDDVINTLTVNYKRKSLKIVPAKLNFSIESINTLKDFSIACGVQLINGLSGDTISSFDFSKLNEVHHIEINDRNCKIRNPKTHRNVSVLLNQINKKIDDTQLEAKKEILRNRSNSLKGRKTTIYLGSHLRSARGIVKDRILMLIGIMNAISRHGIINLEDVECTDLKNTKMIMNHLQSVNFKSVPAACFVHGVLNGFKTASQIKNGSYMLLLDKK